jgi:hypothetical protein
MTKEELAAKLNGREYLSEITEEEEAEAKKNGLCVVFGYFDDNLELRGVWNEEFGAYGGMMLKVDIGGMILKVDIDGPITNKCDSDYCPYYVKLIEEAENFISAKWDEENYSWFIETNLPFAPFDVMEGDKKFCRAIVLEIPKNELRRNNEN